MRCHLPTRSLLMLFLILTLQLSQRSAAQIPRTLSYQAILTDKAGIPKPDGLYTVTFRLYDVSVGGVPLWTETQTLPVKGGLFSAVLGSVTPFGGGLTFTQPYWLSLEVAPEPELVTRLPLTASGYSLGPWTASPSVLYKGNSPTTDDAGTENDIYYNGNVGIGTTAIGAGIKLDVVGVTRLSPGGAGGPIQFGTPNFETGMTISGTAGRADLRFDGSTLKLVAGPGNAGPPSSFNGVAINTLGNIGMGTTTIGSGLKLDIIGATRVSPGGSGGAIQLGSPNFETGLTISGTARADVRFDGSTLKLVAGPAGGPPSSLSGVAIDLAGNVGVGTTNPSARLEVIGRTKTGSLEITAGSDLAEPFETQSNDLVEPGSIMIIDAANPGRLKVSEKSYDTRVAGIVSGAGGVNPGITLKQDGVLEGKSLVAIAGRVYCKADADHGAIEPGDLLTTSNTPGHAMKATNKNRSHGAIIGKAMTGLTKGKGLVLVLVNLQ